MYKIATTNKYDNDVVKCIKRKWTLSLLENVVEVLENNGRVSNEYNPHKLYGLYNDCWECHIKGDWLLIWRIDKKNKIIELVRTGTHSDLF